ncbi:J domain-containing protein [Pantoea sp. SOD02]|uniref:J domain-containing protein n=1 Tax=Pantoea sp. SOD02 TaxID=2970818 RepID=UPI002157A6A2|nr:J domain-containing protein [Pantoea sp. SOD02]UVC31788.1 J domain-containing protein [Pantoea sp. SOD02]
MSHWHILDIEPTQDEALIRRAYSRLLKNHRPESDPEGYQRLREAFEQAKNSAADAALQAETRDVKETDCAEFNSAIDAQQMDEWLATTDVVEADEKLADYAFSLTPLYTTGELSNLAKLLVDEEMQGIKSLRGLYQRVCNEGNLLQQQQFHNDLAAALAEQPELTDGLLQRVSDDLGWGLDDYNVYIISHEMQRALGWQVRNTEREQAWKKLNNESVNGSFMPRTAVTLLLSDRAEMPFWARLVPGLVALMSQRVNGLYAAFPELIERLNPAMLEFIGSERITLSWRGIFLVVFWLVMFHFLLPGALVTSVTGWMGMGLVLFYLFISDMIMCGLKRRPRILEAFLTIEYLFSALLLCILCFSGLFIIINDLPGKWPGGMPYVFLLIIEFLVFWSVWPRNVQGIRRPGIAMSQLISTPWRLIQRLDYAPISWPLTAVFSVFLYKFLILIIKIPSQLCPYW